MALALLLASGAAIADDYAEVCQASLTDISSFAPMADILAAAHVRSLVRMFMN